MNCKNLFECFGTGGGLIFVASTIDTEYSEQHIYFIMYDMYVKPILNEMIYKIYQLDNVLL